VSTAPLPPSLRKAVGVSPPPPLALYVHLPWCLRKCPYCDFNSHESRDGARVQEARYLDALQADIEAALPAVWGRSVSSVFIGGGTPSLFSPEAIDRLLASVRARLPLTPAAEITMEANPGTFEAARFRAFAQAGVTRLSIGVQSFSDQALAALGRVHDASQARGAIETAAQAFDTWNIDLMYGLPQQSLEGLRRDLREALAFEPPHLSYYHLTLEANTLFAKRPPVLPDDDLAADMQQLIEDETAAAGLRHYEVSAYAREGETCRHNLNYWQFGDYLGIGAGAHGKLSFHDRIVRESRLRNPRAYMDAALASGTIEPAPARALRAGGAAPARAAGTVAIANAPATGPIESSHAVSARELPFEFMLNALRLTDGVPAALFAERTGLPIAVIGRQLVQAVERGLLDADPTRIRATPLGTRFLNDLLTIFLPE
jgi:putative oxygen-independent coproporphyrinogen III oxidase